MKTQGRYREELERDLTPSWVLAVRYRYSTGDCGQYWDSDHLGNELTLLTYRGTSLEFAIGAAYCGSADLWDRAMGIRVLGQLGWSECTFLDESLEILIPLLRDQDILVKCEAAHALGHRGDVRAIPHLIRLADHSDAEVRYSVVHGLLTHEDSEAVAALIRLSRDPDYDVRNWAVFGLGSQIEMDTPAIREALWEAWEADASEDSELRGEALVGLAVRRDPRTVDAILKEWEDEMVGRLSIEAAEEIGDPRLLPKLLEFLETMYLEDDPSYENSLLDAIASCRNKGIRDNDAARNPSSQIEAS